VDVAGRRKRLGGEYEKREKKNEYIKIKKLGTLKQTHFSPP
jgi:hypothetical protein